MPPRRRWRTSATNQRSSRPRRSRRRWPKQRTNGRSSWPGADAPGALIGLGCAAAIATDRTKRGDHRAFVSVAIGPGETTSYALNLKKGARERAAEEDLVSRLILNALAQASRIDDRLELPLLAGERIVSRSDSGGSAG